IGSLMQIDKLVQLIESPIFIHLRLQLLEPQRFPFLLKALYGVLMLLPQSPAFASLKMRLESVAPMGTLTCIPNSNFAQTKSNVTIALASASTTATPSAGAASKSPPATPAPATANSGPGSLVSESSILNIGMLLTHFQKIQSVHQAKRQKQFRDSSLLA